MIRYVKRYACKRENGSPNGTSANETNCFFNFFVKASKLSMATSRPIDETKEYNDGSNNRYVAPTAFKDKLTDKNFEMQRGQPSKLPPSRPPRNKKVGVVEISFKI